MLLEKFSRAWGDADVPFLINSQGSLSVGELAASWPLEEIKPGDVVALIGDFDAQTISILIALIDLCAVVVPLTTDTSERHEYLFEASLVDFVIEDGQVRRRQHSDTNHVLEALRLTSHPGLVLFTSGTTGLPKAILHDFSLFLNRYLTRRPPLRTMSFLLFDHIGGLNTLFHTLFNGGVVIAPQSRTVGDVLETCREHQIELLPTTPTFLRMLLLALSPETELPESLRIVTYGTERMDEVTLGILASRFDSVDFRQTYGMSELGILRVSSESRRSLWMKVGGEGVEHKTKEGVLFVKSATRMAGYLNAEDPFDEEGWYNTGDLVESKGGFIKIIGRQSEQINVGGLKFSPAEVETVVLQIPGVRFAKASKRQNPITGEHVELVVDVSPNFEGDEAAIKSFLSLRLPRHMWPVRVRIGTVMISARFKRM